MPDTKRPWTPIHLPPDCAPPAGPYSPAVRAGELLFISGQVPRNPRTGDIEGADVKHQARRTLENLCMVLAAAGAAVDDVVSVIVYLADENDWGAFNEVYREFFRPPYPSRTVVGAQLRGILVEVSAVARIRA